MFRLDNKIGIITGAARGIGSAIARTLASQGATVALVDILLDEVSALASEIGPNARAYQADLAKIDNINAVVKKIASDYGSIDILVNNAGASWGASYETYPESAFDKLFALNVSAAFFLTRDLTSLLQRSAAQTDPARVINIGSMDGLHVPQLIQTGTFAYSASKAAIHHLTRTLAVELGPKHITVNAIAPGFFESKMTAEVLKQHGDAIIDACPLGRIGQPEEMAGIAIYLASRAGAYTNGAVIQVDGGTLLN